MRRLITAAFTFGVCALPSRGAAEPRAPASLARHEKSGSSSKQRPPSVDERYAVLIAAADGDDNGEITRVEIERLVRRHVERRVRTRFRKLDRNRDGRVTREEVPTMLDARFARFDANGDGSFTLRELTAYLQKRAVAQCGVAFARLDIDGDGAVSRHDAEGAKPTRVSQRETKATTKTR